jgi:hypothetical protein
MLSGAHRGGTVPIRQASDSVTKIAEQMPPVSDLHGTGRALANAVGVGAGAITGDDLNTGTIAQPCGESGRFAIRQQIDHLVRLQIDQHSAVALSASPGPIIYPEDAWRWRCWFIGRAGRC